MEDESPTYILKLTLSETGKQIFTPVSQAEQAIRQ